MSPTRHWEITDKYWGGISGSANVRLWREVGALGKGRVWGMFCAEILNSSEKSSRGILNPPQPHWLMILTQTTLPYVTFRASSPLNTSARRLLSSTPGYYYSNRWIVHKNNVSYLFKKENIKSEARASFKKGIVFVKGKPVNNLLGSKIA